MEHAVTPINALELRDITHRYSRGRPALDGVSLCVRRGDCYGFIGHNGAGKTTALRIALGLLHPTTGDVFVDGFDALRYPAEARARLGGLIEHPGFHAGLSGRDNLLLLARLGGLARGAAREEAARVLDVVDLARAAAQPVGSYSQGMRQRLGIAQALLGRPEVVLLDEPTNGLDPDGIQDVRRLLLRLTRQERATVLVSSHQLHELAGICNRVAILREGKLLVEEETARLLDEERYLLRVEDAGRAAAVLAELGIAHESSGDGRALLVRAEGEDTAALLAKLVAGGARPVAFAPQSTTLEDVYLRLTRGAEREPAPRPEAPAGGASAEHGTRPMRRAPGGALRRMVGHEVRRLRSSAGVAIALALPALAAAAAVLLRRAQAHGFAAEMGTGKLESTTDVTAFEGVGVALQAGIPILACVAAGLASQALAGELSRGTLRNVLLRPVRRVQVALGKAAGVLIAAGAGYLLLVVAALVAARLAFAFTDVTELLFNGRRFPLVQAAELWGPLRFALVAPLPALAACTGLGFLAGALTRGPAAALGTALGFLLVPELSRAVLRGFHLEWIVPTAHLPTPLADTSYVAHFVDLARGISNARYDATTASWLVPAMWLTACLVLSCIVFSRRAIR